MDLTQAGNKITEIMDLITQKVTEILTESDRSRGDVKQSLENQNNYIIDLLNTESLKKADIYSPPYANKLGYLMRKEHRSKIIELIEKRMKKN